MHTLGYPRCQIWVLKIGFLFKIDKEMKFYSFKIAKSKNRNGDFATVFQKRLEFERNVWYNSEYRESNQWIDSK